ncbi:hypothetical protein [Actinocrispum sp. NPDC049592]|uniref:hypothetical protein n=1 Tax=Actinocrispum sp. NPDC049592 TaxID=3154835 RepID=UPI0034397727
MPKLVAAVSTAIAGLAIVLSPLGGQHKADDGSPWDSLSSAPSNQQTLGDGSPWDGPVPRTAVTASPASALV